MNITPQSPADTPTETTYVVKEYGGKVEAAISYTKSPVHNEDYFVKLAMQLEKMGADTICIKDMANLLLPYDAYSLVKKLKANVGVPIHLHTHNTTGTGDMTNLMAAQAGVVCQPRHVTRQLLIVPDREDIAVFTRVNQLAHAADKDEQMRWFVLDALYIRCMALLNRDQLSRLDYWLHAHARRELTCI